MTSLQKTIRDAVKTNGYVNLLVGLPVQLPWRQSKPYAEQDTNRKKRQTRGSSL
jgi:hypothetical protein